MHEVRSNGLLTAVRGLIGILTRTSRSATHARSYQPHGVAKLRDAAKPSKRKSLLTIQGKRYGNLQERSLGGVLDSLASSTGSNMKPSVSDYLDSFDDRLLDATSFPASYMQYIKYM